MKSYVKRQLLRIRVYLIFDAKKRTKYIVKKNIFYQVGENFFFQPRKLPSDPKLVKFGNNVSVASDVIFINHDIADQVLNGLNSEIFYNYYVKPIEVGNNVFIGANTIILPNIRIGSNVLIGAGSVVTKDIEDNSVVAGNPAKKISTFSEYIEKRKEYNNEYINTEDIDNIWNKFNNEK